MSFEDEKFLSSWGVIFFAFLALMNYELVPDFRWAEFLLVEVVLGLFGFLKFRKVQHSSVAFYRWGLLLWSSLFVIYSCFTLLLLARTFGWWWLWLLVPLWALMTILLVRVTLHLKDGATSPNTGLMTTFAVAGASFSGVLTFYISKNALMFAITMTMDALLSFVMIASVTVWLRRLVNLRGRPT